MRSWWLLSVLRNCLWYWTELYTNDRTHPTSKPITHRTRKTDVLLLFMLIACWKKSLRLKTVATLYCISMVTLRLLNGNTSKAPRKQVFQLQLEKAQWIVDLAHLDRNGSCAPKKFVFPFFPSDILTENGNRIWNSISSFKRTYIDQRTVFVA